MKQKIMAKYLNVTLQEEVPEHILRTDDDFSSDTDDDDDDEEKSEASYEGKDVVMDHGEEFETNENAGWADAMAKVLKTNVPKKKASVVLAKAKKLTDISKDKKAPEIGFEIEGEIKEDKPGPASIQEEIPKKKRKSHSERRAEWRLIARVKPSVLDKNREKSLAKIATKGVVQLFNTVRKHQLKINEQLNEAGTFRKKEKILKSVDKNAFLDMLMGPTSSVQQKSERRKPGSKGEREEEEEKVPWKALRDDFMMGGNLKDWDKELENPNLSTKTKEVKKAESDSD